MFGTKPAVLEQFTFGHAPFVLGFGEKDCFSAKSAPILISNVNYFKPVCRRTVKCVQSTYICLYLYFRERGRATLAAN